jgi:archaemetzincin
VNSFRLSLLLAVGIQMSFTPPTHEERLEAIGSTHGLPSPLRKALDPVSDFEPISVPGPGDWLAVHPEPGQTYDAFIRTGPNEPKGRRTRIYLQPLGDFTEGRSPALETLRAYAAAYFSIGVHIRSPLNTGERNLTTRLNTLTGNRQILTGDVLKLLRSELPSDAFCMLAMTMEDLYPEPSWNFVFGQASLRQRVGVFSFVRYDPAFYGERVSDRDQEILLRRSLKVLVHETAHMFSLTHCIYFQCVLNGSNHCPSFPQHGQSVAGCQETVSGLTMLDRDVTGEILQYGSPDRP